MKTIDKKEKVPAHPPEDYKGTQAGWLVSLNERGLENGQYISQKLWWKILEENED